MCLSSSSVHRVRNPFAVLYRWCKRIWGPNPFIVLLRNAQTDLTIRIWTIIVTIRLKKPEKNGFGPFSYKFFVFIRVGLRNVFQELGIKPAKTPTKVGTFQPLKGTIPHLLELSSNTVTINSLKQQNIIIIAYGISVIIPRGCNSH